MAVSEQEWRVSQPSALRISRKANTAAKLNLSPDAYFSILVESKRKKDSEDDSDCKEIEDEQEVLC